MKAKMKTLRRLNPHLLFLLFVFVLVRQVMAMTLTGEFNWIHDPSRIVKCDGKYYLYYSGVNIPMRYSTDLLNWKTGAPVFESLPEWAIKAVPKADGKYVWAPDVIFLNDKYYLFYSYSTFGSQVSVTGLLTSPTLDPDSPKYKWADMGLVIATNGKQAYNAIDPAPILDERGELWVSVGSWDKGGIKLAKLDKNTGKPIGEMSTLAARQPTGPEAPYLHYHDGYYYLFENEGFCCRGAGSTYAIMMGRSKAITGPYLDKNGKDMAQGGGTAFLQSDGQEIGPGHIGIFSEDGIDCFTYHYYDSRSNGVPTLGMKTLVWGEDGWPSAGLELTPGRYAIISKASGLALGVHDVSFEDGAPVDQFELRGGPFQEWNVSPVGDGFYAITSMATGKTMDLFECSTKDGAKISQYAWYGNDCQKWRIEQTSNGAFRIISKGGGTALTLPGGDKTLRALMQGFAWKGEDGQQWVFKKLP
jgi:arabinan endo-1,5-alpha-L-arabinosidase